MGRGVHRVGQDATGLGPFWGGLQRGDNCYTSIAIRARDGKVARGVHRVGQDTTVGYRLQRHGNGLGTCSEHWVLVRRESSGFEREDDI